MFVLKSTFFLTVKILTVTNNLIAQELVPNGGFEQYIGCPDFEGQIDSSKFWINSSVVGNFPNHNLENIQWMYI